MLRELQVRALSTLSISYNEEDSMGESQERLFVVSIFWRMTVAHTGPLSGTCREKEVNKFVKKVFLCTTAVRFKGQL